MKYAWEKPYFKNREEAAHLLAEKLEPYKGRNPFVLAIPRGAVNMGRIIAEALDGELDVVLVHKLGAPDNPELAVGAVSEEGDIYAARYAKSLGVTEEALQKEAERQLEVLRHRRKIYSPDRRAPDLDKRIVILVDDGIATGSTVLAAVRQVRHQGPLRVIVATAVIPPETADALRREADEVVALSITPYFGAVGEFFEDFPQVSDEEVVRILNSRYGVPKAKKAPPPTEKRSKIT